MNAINAPLHSNVRNEHAVNGEGLGERVSAQMMGCWGPNLADRGSPMFTRPDDNGVRYLRIPLDTL